MAKLEATKAEMQQETKTNGEQIPQIQSLSGQPRVEPADDFLSCLKSACAMGGGLKKTR